MLDVRAVEFSYNGKKTLQSVSLRVEAGDFIGVIGPNGSGKSTLLRLMSKILTPQKGEVLLFGKRLENYGVTELAKTMAVLPAETHFAYDFSVLDIVKMGRAPHLGFWSEAGPADLGIVRAALEAVSIPHLEARNIHALSSGERQMVFLAQALAQEPRILLLDEPTVHLDIRHQLDIFRLLKEWNEKRNLTTVVISHDLNVASQFCKKLVLLSQGEIAVQGTPKEVITEDHIRKVYGIDARIMAHPATGSPTVLSQ